MKPIHSVQVQEIALFRLRTVLLRYLFAWTVQETLKHYWHSEGGSGKRSLSD
jgi:hypothetical protein